MGLCPDGLKNGINFAIEQEWAYIEVGLYPGGSLLEILQYLKSYKTGKHLSLLLLYIQVLLVGGIMGEETGSRSKFNSVTFYEVVSKLPPIYHLRSFSIAHPRWMSEFQT